MSLRVGIVGAGLSGRLAALACLHRGFKVDLFDADDRLGKNSCGWVAAGMLAPFTELESSELLISQLGIESLQHWPNILQQLITPVSFHQQGTLLLAHPQDMGELRRVHSILTYKSPQVGGVIECMTPNKLNEFVPGLSPLFQEGYWVKREGHIHPHEFYEASTATFIAKGVCWYEHTRVEKVEPYQVTVEDHVYHYDLVMDCRGLGAKATWPHLRGVRGELICLTTPEVSLNCPVRIMHPRYPIYISPRPNHVFVVGATVIESEDKSEISVQSMLELLSACYMLHPGFAEARILSTYTECRPVLPDHHPRLWAEAGLIRLNGLYRHGYLVGPAVVEDMMRYLEGGKEAMNYPELILSLNIAHNIY